MFPNVHNSLNGRDQGARRTTGRTTALPQDRRTTGRTGLRPFGPQNRPAFSPSALLDFVLCTHWDMPLSTLSTMSALPTLSTMSTFSTLSLSTSSTGFGDTHRELSLWVNDIPQYHFQSFKAYELEQIGVYLIFEHSDSDTIFQEHSRT